jgi:acetyl-CoA acetyltransferase family protein
MRYERASIPLGKYWTSPFARWQGPFAEMSSLDLATVTTAWALEDRRLSPRDLSHIVLGWSVPQPGIFYGAPTVAARLGAPGITGPMISQACATSVACLQAAALMAEAEADGLGLVIATDRTSNGPHLIYPSPSRPGGAPSSENWVLDSFRRDPWAGKAMIDTAEKVAADSGITREELDEVTLLRYDQYRDALADDRAFQRAYMVPVEIRAQRGDPQVIGGDVGIHETSSEGLAKLEPVLPDGVITYGSQTHPADGAAGMVVASKEVARDVAGDGGIVRILSSRFARVGKAEMPKAPVPAALAALKDVGLEIKDVDAVTTHNPFAVNDVWFSKRTGYPIDKMNLFGSSLVYGHPQAPTGARLIIELIETLRHRGGGTGLFTGCAAGDTGAAVVVRLD